MPSMTATERNELARQWLPLAYKMAGRFVAGRDYDLDDARSDAAFALAKAVLSFDPSRNIPWLVFLTVQVRSELRDRLRRRAFLSRGGKRPRQVPTLAIEDRGAEPQSELESAEAFERIIRPLSQREQHIMRLVFVDGRLRAELPAIIGVCQSTAFELFSKAIKHLREVTPC